MISAKAVKETQLTWVDCGDVVLRTPSVECLPDVFVQLLFWWVGPVVCPQLAQQVTSVFAGVFAVRAVPLGGGLHVGGVAAVVVHCVEQFAAGDTFLRQT